MYGVDVGAGAGSGVGTGLAAAAGVGLGLVVGAPGGSEGLQENSATASRMATADRVALMSESRGKDRTISGIERSWEPLLFSLVLCGFLTHAPVASLPREGHLKVAD